MTSKSSLRNSQETSFSQLTMATSPSPMARGPSSWVQPNRTRDFNLRRSSRFPDLSRTSTFTKTRCLFVIKTYILRPESTFRRFLRRQSPPRSSLKMAGSFSGAFKSLWRSRSTSTWIRNTQLTADTILRPAGAPESCHQSGWGKTRSCLVRYFALRSTSLSSLILNKRDLTKRRWLLTRHIIRSPNVYNMSS